MPHLFRSGPKSFHLSFASCRSSLLAPRKCGGRSVIRKTSRTALAARRLRYALIAGFASDQTSCPASFGTLNSSSGSGTNFMNATDCLMHIKSTAREQTIKTNMRRKRALQNPTTRTRPTESRKGWQAATAECKAGIPWIGKASNSYVWPWLWDANTTQAWGKCRRCNLQPDSPQLNAHFEQKLEMRSVFAPQPQPDGRTP